MKQNTAKYLTQAAMIAALYAALTYLSSVLNLAYGPVQFRLSEALTVLAAFTPAAIPGLTIGCLLGNLGSPFGLVDILCGAAATFLAALVTRWLRNICVKGVPILAPLPPVIFNAVIIGMEIAIFLPEGFTFPAFLISGLQVGAGELGVCYLLGIPLAILIQRNKGLNRIFQTGR